MKAILQIVLISLVFGTVMTSCHEEWRECLTSCEAEPEVGDCDAAIPRYYWDADEGKCKEFTWGGCGGIVPFETLEECEDCGCQDL